MDVNEIQKIIEILKDSDVTEFEFEREGTTVRIARSQTQTIVQLPSAGQVEPAILRADSGKISEGDATPQATDEHLVSVESPIVGTFYKKPSPDADPFVEVGSRVKAGDTLCIVEAMKLMNEIEAPVSGVIEKVLLSDGQVVEYGEVLFKIKPD